jgi:ribosomal protein S18 acetylase RimI-like enzyme
MNAEVAPANLSDLDAIADLRTELVAGQRAHGAHLLADGNRETARDFLGQAVAADNVFVADVGGETVGFVQFRVESGIYDQSVERGFVDNVYVRPPYRSRGIGSRLLSAAESALAARDVERVALSVLADNDAARRFYERHGYGAHRVELEQSLESDTPSKDGAKE